MGRVGAAAVAVGAGPGRGWDPGRAGPAGSVAWAGPGRERTGAPGGVRDASWRELAAAAGAEGGGGKWGAGARRRRAGLSLFYGRGSRALRGGLSGGAACLPP